ncbi:MAG: DHHA1 domain-containing protein, partial [candidate division WOR-3 bacterium]|nr:DHHA1 domain-containing protein [candidate division WOR-3 bacterium]
IIENHEAKPDEMSREEAEALGALAFFGEKYGDKVRVLQIRDKNTEELISAELCGGTHLESTGQIGMFIIASETGVAAGIRRIEALVGKTAWEEIKNRREVDDEISKELNTSFEMLLKSVKDQKYNLYKETKEKEKFEGLYLESRVQDILNNAVRFEETEIVVAKVAGLSRRGLRILADQLKSKRDRIVGLLVAPELPRDIAHLAAMIGSPIKGYRPWPILCFSSKVASKNYPAGEILKRILSGGKGGGGGSPTLAEGSIAEASLEDLTSTFLEIVKARREEK